MQIDRSRLIDVRRCVPAGCCCDRAEEFYAHDGPINCVSLGRQSCSVFVSGGDDKIVKVWKIGRPTPIMVEHTHRHMHGKRREEEARDGAHRATSGSVAHSLPVCVTPQSLDGHTSEVDSAMFDVKETQVAAGSRGGGIKLWDLDKQQCQAPHR